MEIRRLIEDIRNTPKEEKQRLKEVEQTQKMHQGQKMKRQQDIQRILGDFKGVRNIPGINSARSRVLNTKKKNEKGEVITSKKGITNVFGEYYKKPYDDKEQEETEQKIGENENDSSIDVHSSNTDVMMRIPVITTEELQYCNQQNS